MSRILIAAFKQETSSFNPRVTGTDIFQICRGEEIIADLKGTRTEIGGLLDVFEEAGDIQVVPTYAAWSVSGGPVGTEDLNQMIDELLGSVRENKNVDGALIVLHGAMAGETEVDPEGKVLTAIRETLGSIPIVITMDLHAILTDRILEVADLLFPFHTYPHTDHYETGQRGAHGLLKLLRQSVTPTTSRVKIPMLVRGDELITATGRFGQAIRDCQALESSEDGLAAGVLIGNPFTDVPDLRSNVIVSTDGNADRATEEANRIAQYMWDNRNHFVAPLTPLDQAIRQAEETDGLTVFSDAADATSSGASGDSNHILKGLIESDFSKKALLPLVDAPAVDAAFKAGVSNTITVPLGGAIDKGRHSPIECEAYVKALFDGKYTTEDGTTNNAGRTAVLITENCTVMTTTNPVSIMGRKVFLARGLDPEDFDLVVCKSPNGFRTHYESISSLIVPVDVPGSTSANLKSLPYQHCARPVFPLDENVTFP